MRGPALEALATRWKGLDPRLKAALGVLAGGGVYAATADVAAKAIADRAEVGEDVGDIAPLPIEKDPKGEDLLRWVERFRERHPSAGTVPVYISGKVPGSVYVPEASTKLPVMGEVLKREFKIEGPGVYLREYSAPVALHELGHAAIDKKVPGISLLTHGASLLALAPIAWMLLRKPGAKPAFVEKYAPGIAAALQIPMLAEEAAASIIAERTLREKGETGKGVLVPAWLSHAAVKAKWPLMAAGAALLRKA
jgi:hypothetical protein